MITPRSKVLCLAILTLLGFAGTTKAQEAKSETNPKFTYYADAVVCSYLPDDVIGSYQKLGGGGFSPGSTLSLGVRGRNCRVLMEGKRKPQQFLVRVTVVPEKGDTQTKAQKVEYDLSDISARSLEIARDADGRVVKLSLAPRVVEHPAAKPFKVDELRLECWSFPASPVVLNDQDYIGQLGMSYGQLASCDIPGVASIEFCLLRLKDALPLGTLKDGIIQIKHDSGTTLTISNVQNGIHHQTLTGGPYQVWVRWNKPTETVEEYRQSLKQLIARLKERMQNGDDEVQPTTIERLEKMSQSDRIGLSSSQVRSVSQDELADPAQ